MADGGILSAERPLAGALAPGGPKGMARGQPFDGVPERAFTDLALTFGFGPMMGVMISDPAAVRRVLVEAAGDYPKSPMDQSFFGAIFGDGLLSVQGETWRRHRRIMAPAFDPRSVQSYGPAIASATAAFRRGWAAQPDGAVVAMEKEMNRLALDIVSSAVFATDSAEIKDEVAGALHAGLAEALDAGPLDLIPVLKDLRMNRRRRAMAKATQKLDALLKRLIEERSDHRAEGSKDLLTRLVQTKDEGGTGGLSLKEIRDEVITIFMAGHETTSVTLQWIWYLLAERPRIAERLHAELDAVLNGRAAETGDLPELSFTRRVVEEAMRLYPAAPGISTRRAAKDDVLAGIRVRRGMGVNILPWVLHRHRSHWEDPETFDPDRFLPERAEGRSRFVYLPFGAGPRVCIGQRLAMDEIILILATLAQDVAPELAGPLPPQLKAVITLQAVGGLPMRLKKRASAAEGAPL